MAILDFFSNDGNLRYSTLKTFSAFSNIYAHFNSSLNLVKSNLKKSAYWPHIWPSDLKLDLGFKLNFGSFNY